ncbi:MAG TPA: hypothetical protein VF167_16965 [Longimicrobiaceae bacterium]
MPSIRPSECPACGHEGICRAARAATRADSSSRRDIRAEVWTCRLCGYTWSDRGPQRRRPSEGIDFAHP